MDQFIYVEEGKKRIDKGKIQIDKGKIQILYKAYTISVASLSTIPYIWSKDRRWKKDGQKGMRASP